VAGVVVEGALAVVVELEVEQVAVALVGVAQDLEVVPEREVPGRAVVAVLEPEQAVAAVPELALVRLQGQALALVQEPRSVLDLMHP
jgi:hypothetical protein